MDERNTRIQSPVSEAVGSKPFYRSSFLSAILLLFLCFACYWNTLDGKFQYDDYRVIRFNVFLRGTNWKEIIKTEPSRPLSILSFALNFQGSKTNTTPYHVVNISLHFIAVFLFYLFLRRIMGNNFWPLVAAVIMAVHPLNTEAVSYISARSIVLCSVFYLSAMLFYDSHLRNPSWRSAAGFIACFVLAALSKENAVMIPFSAALYGLLFHGKEKFKGSRNPIIVVMALTFIAGLYRLFFVSDVWPGAPALSYWITEASVWARYLWLAIYPVQLNVDHDIRALTVLSPLFIASLLLITGICVLLYKVRKSHPIVSFWGFWFFLNLLPSTVIPLNEFMSEHLTYLSMFGFCACLSYVFVILFKPLVKPAPLMWVVIVLLCGLAAYGTIHRNRVWKDGLTLWSDAVEKSPQKIRPHLNLGDAYIQQKAFDKATREYSLALSYNPHLKEGFSGLGIAYLRMGAISWAEDYFRRALKEDPKFMDAQVGLGFVMYQNGQCDEALKYFESVYGVRAESEEITGMMADCYVQKKDYNSAIHVLKGLVNSGTASGNMYAALMETYFLQKQYKESLAVYDQYKDRFPPTPLTQLRVATILRDLGRVDQARAILTIVSTDVRYGKTAKNILREIDQHK